jgi:hypothetical protein
MNVKKLFSLFKISCKWLANLVPQLDDSLLGESAQLDDWDAGLVQLVLQQLKDKWDLTII